MTPEPTPVRVVIADDSAGIRRAFRALLRSDPRVVLVGEAADGEEAIRVVKEFTPDVVLMDVQMPRLSGLVATEQILQAAPGVRVVVVTTFDLDEYVYEALRVGASGFLLKNAPPEEVLRAILTVHQGNAMLAPEVTARLIAGLSTRKTTQPSPFTNGVLSDRELEVTRLVARGLSNAEIASELYISTETAKTYVIRILVKLRVRDRTQLAVLAHEAGLLRSER